MDLKSLRRRIERVREAATPPRRPPYEPTSPEVREQLRGMIRTDLAAGTLADWLTWLIGEGECTAENIRQLFHGQRDEAEVIAVLDQVAPSTNGGN